MKTFSGGMRYRKSFEDMTPDRLAHLEELRGAMGDAVSRLPPKQQMVMALWVDGWSAAEIAEKMGATVPRVLWNVSKGKRSMRSSLKKFS